MWGGFNASIDGSGFFITKQTRDKVPNSNDDIKGADFEFTRVGQFLVDNNGFVVDANGRFVYGFKPNIADTTIQNEVIAAQMSLKNANDTLTVKKSSEDKAQAEVDKAQAEVDEAQAEVNDLQISDPDGKLTDAQKKLTDAQKKLTDAKKKLTDAQGEVSSAQTALAGAADVYTKAQNKAEGFATKDLVPLRIPLVKVNDDGYPTFAYNTNEPVAKENSASPCVTIQLNNAGVVTAAVKYEKNGAMTSTTVEVGKVGIATFQNPNGLSKSGGSYYKAIGSDNSGQTTAAGPGDAGTATLMGGFLEASNVDLAKEFSDMITTQRGFQANAKIITVSDEILQELVSMKR